MTCSWWYGRICGWRKKGEGGVGCFFFFFLFFLLSTSNPPMMVTFHTPRMITLLRPGKSGVQWTYSGHQQIWPHHMGVRSVKKVIFVEKKKMTKRMVSFFVDWCSKFQLLLLTHCARLKTIYLMRARVLLYHFIKRWRGSILIMIKKKIVKNHYQMKWSDNMVYNYILPRKYILHTNWQMHMMCVLGCVAWL